MRSLFLQSPSFDGYDGGAGARYQAKREIKSFWYPTWLAQPAALVEGSKLIDAPAHDLTFDDIKHEAMQRDLVVIHTSTPGFKQDVRVAGMLKELNPNLKVGFIGATVAVDAAWAMANAPTVDFVARNEFDFTILDVAQDKPLADIKGISFRNSEGVIVHNEDRDVLMDMDSLPFVSPIYKRDLVMENYFIGYLKHPYVSFYTGRGCKSRCTFCLWPQTVGGHNYRVRSVGHVIEEVKYVLKEFPQMQELFFDDDTLTDNIPRVEELARELGKLGVTWSCNAKANVPYDTLKIMRDNGLRLLLVGYESGNQQILHNIKKGLRIEVAKQFARDCRALGIKIHGTFIMG
ncbi:MAG: hopanoid biosynthesis associated radical SAM protein HpnJ, partial [Zymomonas sp.]|nr:hopanoid biosynthesis associated radical SAM protein HpnJ [Zymomonas sp.]